MSDQSKPGDGVGVSQAPWLRKLLDQNHQSQVLRQSLRGFTGSQTVYKHRMNPLFCYTEGFRHFLRSAGGGAYWLADILALQPEILRASASQGKLSVSLEVEVGQATLQILGAADGKECYRKFIDHTDCPPGHWKFLIGPGIVGERRVHIACLPGED